MSGALCTINGQAALRATVVIPRSRIWTAEIEAANMLDISGPVTIELSDIELKGTIVEGGPYATRGWYRVVGGFGGWRKALAPKAYASAAGVKLSTIVKDAAGEVGENVAAFTDRRVGPAYVRPPSLEGDKLSVEAARVLDALAPENWYVDLDGSTHIGARAAADFKPIYRLLDKVPSSRRIMIASDTLVGLVPGAKLEGLEAATVRHELTSSTLRTHVYGTMGKSVMDRAWRSLARIIRAETLQYLYAGTFEYQVIDGSGGYLDVRPVNASLGLPTLGNVPVRVGMMGARGTPASSSTVYVAFVNLDPTRPYIDSFEGESGADSVPSESNVFADSMKLGDAGAVPVARGDKVYTELGRISTAIGLLGGTYTPPATPSAIETSKVSLS